MQYTAVMAKSLTVYIKTVYVTIHLKNIMNLIKLGHLLIFFYMTKYTFCVSHRVHFCQAFEQLCALIYTHSLLLRATFQSFQGTSVLFSKIGCSITWTFFCMMTAFLLSATIRNNILSSFWLSVLDSTDAFKVIKSKKTLLYTQALKRECRGHNWRVTQITWLLFNKSSCANEQKAIQNVFRSGVISSICPNVLTKRVLCDALDQECQTQTHSGPK